MLILINYVRSFYRNTDFENQIDDLLNAKQRGFYGKFFLSAIKSGLEPRIIEVYEPETAEQIVELRAAYQKALVKFKTDPTSDNLEYFMNSMAHYAKFRSERIAAALNDMGTRTYAKGREAVLFVGQAHADVINLLKGIDVSAKPMNLNVSLPVYTDALLKKINDPTYKLSAVEQAGITAELTR